MTWHKKFPIEYTEICDVPCLFKNILELEIKKTNGDFLIRHLVYNRITMHFGLGFLYSVLIL